MINQFEQDNDSILSPLRGVGGLLDKVKGVDYRLVLLHNIERRIELLNGKTNKLQSSDSSSLALTLYIDGREGFFYTNIFDEDALQSFVSQSIETTRLLAPDEARVLPSPERYYKGGGADLQNFDATLFEPSDLPLDLCRQTSADVLGKDPRIISVDCRYQDRIHLGKYLTSNGFEAEERCTRCTLSSIVSVKGEGDQKPMDGWGQTRLFLNDMSHIGLGETALNRALRKIGQRPTKKGRYTMVVESPVAPQLLEPLLSAMAGQALQQHSSFLEGRLNDVFGSPLLDIMDNPHLPGTRGATYFDYDGVATRPMKLFDKGRLQTYFIDTPMSRKLGMAPTTQGTHHLILSSSSLSLDELLLQQDECILVTDFNGGNCNPVTGHFSYGVEGFLYRQGQMVQPISGMNITGTMEQLWKSLVQVGGDADPYETEIVPSLVFEGIDFA